MSYKILSKSGLGLIYDMFVQRISNYQTLMHEMQNIADISSHDQVVTIIRLSMAYLQWGNLKRIERKNGDCWLQNLLARWRFIGLHKAVM